MRAMGIVFLIMTVVVGRVTAQTCDLSEAAGRGDEAVVLPVEGYIRPADSGAFQPSPQSPASSAATRAMISPATASLD